MPKLTHVFDLFDEQSEIMAWLIILLTVVAWISGFGDWPAVALISLACFLMGFIRKLKAGPSGIDITRD